VTAWCGERREALPVFAEGAARRAVEAVLEEGQPIAWEGTGPHQERSPAPPEPPDSSYLPLRMKDRVLGVLYLHWRPGRQTTAEEIGRASCRERRWREE